jgi:hypothetical protein
MTRFLGLAAVLAVVPAFAADAPAPGIPVASVGVVSPDQKTVFVPAKAGGVEALDLASGRVMWVNKDASKLAGGSDKMVFAWVGDEKKANAFRVVAMDAATGKTLGKSDPIALPDWASTAQPWGRKFRTAARVDGEGVVVMWQAGAFYAGGARPSPEIEAAARKNESGLVKFDLKTGKVTLADGKPKDDDFKAGPAGGGTNKLGDYEFAATEQEPGFKPGAPRMTTVTFTVLKGGKELWKRELAGNPWSPPPP